MQNFFIVKSFKIKEEINHGVFQFFEDAIEYVKLKETEEDAVFYHVEKHRLSKPNTCEVVHSTLIINELFLNKTKQ
jgi:hypothetical protein